MKLVFVWLAMVSMGAQVAGADETSPLASLKVEKSRVQGNWQIRCEIDHPVEADAAKVGIMLKRRCRNAASRFAAKQHTESGGLYRQDVSEPEANKDRSKLAIQISLHKR